MKNLKSLLNYLAAGACCLMILTQVGCKKDGGFFDAVNEEDVSDLSTYDYLKSKRGIYDSLLYVIDRVGLADTLKNNKVTLFAPTNESFKLAITNLNNLRKATGKDPLSLSNIDLRHLDTLMTKYIIRGLYTSESLKQQDGLMFYGVRYDRMMHAKLSSSTSSGYLSGGPGYLQFDDTKQSIFTKFWASTTTGSIDIKTKNGIVHIVDPNHIFGFDEFVKRITFIPKTQLPFLGKPFELPGLINAVDFDLGGQGVAYSDADPDVNKGAFYRGAEGVDILLNGNNGFLVHETVTGEWLEYTVNVKEAGNFEMTVRTGTDQEGRRYSMEVDGVNVTGGAVTIPSTQNPRQWSNIKRDVALTAGKHIIRFNVVSGGFNLFQFFFNAKLTNLPDGLNLTWIEHWLDTHKSLLTLDYYNDEIAVYKDKDVPSSVTWPYQLMTDVWKHTKQVYGDFGPDKRLYIVMHGGTGSGGGGGRFLPYFDVDGDYRSIVDVGITDDGWMTNIDFCRPALIHELCHVVESSTNGVKGSPSYELWGDSKWQDIFIYDTYKSLGLTAFADAWVVQYNADVQSYPRANSRWFRDWWIPIYNQYGGSAMLSNYFELLAANLHTKPHPKGLEFDDTLNWGEFVHFWSGAAGANLKQQFTTAFGWTPEWQAEFEQAQKEFPNVKY